MSGNLLGLAKEHRERAAEFYDEAAGDVSAATGATLKVAGSVHDLAATLVVSNVGSDEVGAAIRSLQEYVQELDDATEELVQVTDKAAKGGAPWGAIKAARAKLAEVIAKGRSL